MIVRLSGGLCNQMFMYSFGRALSMERHDPVKFVWARSTWDYGLGDFNTLIELTNPPIHAPIYEEPGFAFDQGVYTSLKGSYFKGYWQSEKYFEKYSSEIRQELTLKCVLPETEKQAEKLRNQNSVAVHIRRGDYINSGTKEFHGILPWEYYRDAKNYLREKINNPKFFFFSDESEDWVKDNFYIDFSSGEEETVHTGNASQDLYLMSQCRHGIMANSTFGWWSNWLGDYSERIVVAPQKWFQADMDTKDLIPDRWIRL